MFISSSPLRVSLLGGGTDIPEYFNKFGKGRVLGLVINRHVHVMAQVLEFKTNFNFRLSYSSHQDVMDISQITHPIFKEVLKKIQNRSLPIHFSTKSSLASGSGLASSSAFTVALLDVVNRLNGQSNTPIELAQEAIRIEREILGESGGWQDQYFASHSGVQAMEFFNSKCRVQNIQCNAWKDSLKSRLFLVPTNKTRRAHQIESSKTMDRLSFDELSSLAQKGTELFLKDNVDLREIGRLIDQGWKIKKSLSSEVSDADIDHTVKLIKNKGAYGVKICGAGGGGMLAVLAERDVMNQLYMTYGMPYVQISIETNGITRKEF